MPDFIPRTDKGALEWMEAFQEGTSNDPAKYGLSPADATAIANAVGEFKHWMDYIKIPSKKNKVTVAAKDDARIAATQICRQYAILIKYNSGISDPDKIDIGVRPVNPTREPIHVPQVSPQLDVDGSTPGCHTITYKGPTPEKPRAKPFGAANLQLFVAVADEIEVDWKKARFVGAFTTTPIGVMYEPEDNKKIATYFARWASVRGNVGPWSNAVAFTIAA